MTRQKAQVSLLELNIRAAWQRMAEEQGLTPAAAFWRWKALHQQPQRPVYWLKQPWGKERP
jgi:hypothetical protein